MLLTLILAASAPAPAPALQHNLPSMVAADGQLRFDYGDERMLLPGGLQPSLLCTRDGTLIVQGQAPRKPVNTPRFHYPSALDTVVSRDEGKTWTLMPVGAGENGINLEGGAVQLRDGTILALDTYAVPKAGGGPGQAEGWLFTSHDDWHTLQGPKVVPFDLPGADFAGGADDGGRPYAAERLHRRIVELPDGDLITTIYGLWQGDRIPATYEHRMMKTRVVLVRSHDRGQHWQLVSTVAVGDVGTEGFGEPVVERVTAGAHPGRYLALIRTGRNLYETTSDDEGRTWTPAHPRIFGGLDVERTELWVDMFRHIRGRSGKLLDENNPDELKGAVVDPDLLTLRSGLLVAAFGVRIPQKACWPHSEHPWNGNYLAVSRDGGATWPNVIRLTSGIPTTHYMAIEQMPGDDRIFVAYDFGYWGHNPRYVYGRTVSITARAP